MWSLVKIRNEESYLISNSISTKFEVKKKPNSLHPLPLLPSEGPPDSNQLPESKPNRALKVEKKKASTTAKEHIEDRHHKSKEARRKQPTSNRGNKEVEARRW